MVALVADIEAFEASEGHSVVEVIVILPISAGGQGWIIEVRATLRVRDGRCFTLLKARTTYTP